jgi:hypothetical protein
MNIAMTHQNLGENTLPGLPLIKQAASSFFLATPSSMTIRNNNWGAGVTFKKTLVDGNKTKIDNLELNLHEMVTLFAILYGTP